jgi:hypothetical protein
MSISSLLTLCAWALCTVLAHGFTIEIPQGTLTKYQYLGYRQHPFYAFGIYSKDSFLAKLSGHTDLHPHVQFFIDAQGGPSQYFQVYLYNADVVEGTIMPSTLHSVTPCMDIGQDRGVAVFSNMTRFAFALNSGGEMIGTSAQYPMFSVREGIFPENTGLYVVTMNACRYVKNASGDRVLKVDDWSATTIEGSIVVRNPFGYLPGQLYGFIPAYSVLLVLSVGVFAVYGLFCFRVRKNLLSYHWAMLLVGGQSVASYTLLLSYYSTLNEQNIDRFGVLVCGTICIILRNTFGALVVYLMCYGYKVIVHTMHPVKLGLIVAATVARLALNLSEAGLLFSATRSTYGMWGLWSMQEAHLGWKVTRTFGLAVDVMIGAATAGTLFVTLRHLRSAAWKRRLMLYRRTAAVIAFGVVLGLLWISIVFWAAEGPLGQFAETQWKLFWLPTILFEVTYFTTVSGVMIVWLPRKGDLFFLHAETAAIEQCPPPGENGASEDEEMSASTPQRSSQSRIVVSNDT